LLTLLLTDLSSPQGCGRDWCICLHSSAEEDLSWQIAVCSWRQPKFHQGMHEGLVIKMVFKQHVLDDADGAFSQSVARGLVRGRVVDNNFLSLARFLNSVMKQGLVSHLISPGLPSKKNIFSMCPMIDSAVCELSLATSGNPEYLSTTIRK
jgi:hypothetical protein